MFGMEFEPISFAIIIAILMVIVALNVLYFQHEKSWGRLQRKFYFSEKLFWGKTLRTKRISISGKRIHSYVKIKVSRRGMFLKPYLPQSIFSHSVLIPWGDILEVEVNEKWFRHKKRLVIKDNSNLSVDISKSEFRSISKYISHINSNA